MFNVINKIIVFLVISSFAPILMGADLFFSRNARTYELQSSTLIMKSMAYSCLGIRILPDGLPCNPAMTPFTTKSSLGVEVQLSNGYSSFDKVRKLTGGEFNQELVDSLFEQGKIIQIEATADVTFKSKFLNGQYKPVSTKGFSVVRNEANPDVEISTMDETGFTFQSGFELYEQLYLGAQIRLLQRKFIKKRFQLVELATQNGRDLLKPNKQNVTYIDPALTYFIPFKKWQPRVTYMVANLGQVSERYDEINEPVDHQFSLAVSPPVWWGALDLTLEYRSLSYSEDDSEKIRFGALYGYGSMYLSGGIDAAGLSGGVYYALDKINAGVIYSTTKGFKEGESFYTQTVYVQLGWQI